MRIWSDIKEQHRRKYRVNGDALKEFPYNLDLMSALCHALLFEKHGKEENLDECIDIVLRILERSTDDEQRHKTIETLVYAYSRKNNKRRQSNTPKITELPVHTKRNIRIRIGR